MIAVHGSKYYQKIVNLPLNDLREGADLTSYSTGKHHCS
jgi:hypothetical protein